MYILDNYSLTVKIINSEVQVKSGKLEIHDTVDGEAKEINFSEVSLANWEIEDLDETAHILQNDPFFFHLETPMSEPARLHIYCPHQESYLEIVGFISIV